MPVQTLVWENDILRLVDQTRLPAVLEYLECRDVETVAQAIERLSVRGAPAIGVAAAYGVVLAALEASRRRDGSFVDQVRAGIDRLAATRPTAVNLFWALQQMRAELDQASAQDPATVCQVLLDTADRLYQDDRRICRTLGRHGAELLPDGANVITHCNAGALATADYGTALGVIYAACEQGKRIHVYADETRPLLQGSRLTAWELMKAGVEVTVICDNMAAAVMRRTDIHCVIVGADRIAANGDVANKIGTYGLAVAADAHGVPVYVAAPVSTLDMSLAHGEQIPIEERAPDEVTHGMGQWTAPQGVPVFNPAFDVTPNHLVTAIISERGIARPPFRPALAGWTQESTP